MPQMNFMINKPWMGSARRGIKVWYRKCRCGDSGLLRFCHPRATFNFLNSQKASFSVPVILYKLLVTFHYSLARIF